jgi:hypothetical protein
VSNASVAPHDPLYLTSYTSSISLSYFFHFLTNKKSGIYRFLVFLAIVTKEAASTSKSRFDIQAYTFIIPDHPSLHGWSGGATVHVGALAMP